MSDVTASITLNAIVKGLSSFVQFSNQINKTTSEADKLDNSLHNLNNTAEALDRITGIFDKMANFFSSVSGLVISLTSDVLNSAVSFDKLYRSLEFVSGGSNAAKEKLKELEEVAKLPGLGFREAIEGQVQLQSTMKVTEKTTTDLIKAIGKGVAVSGGGKEQLKGALFQFTQIAGRGKFEGEDINTIAEKVRNFKVALQQEFKVTTSKELNKIVDKEGIDKVLQRISSRLNELNKNATNLNGASNGIENLTDAIDKLKISIGSSILEEFGALLNYVANAINYVRDSFEALTPAQKKTVFAIAGVVAGISALIAGLLGIAAFITSAIVAFTALVAVVGSVGSAIAVILIPIAVMLALLPVIVGAIGAVGIAIYAFYQLWQKNFDGIQQKVAKAVDAIQKEFDRLRYIIMYIYEGILPKFKQAVQTILTAIENYWKKNGETIISYVQIAWSYITGFIEKSMFAIGQAIELVLNLINGDTGKALLNAQTLWYYFVNTVLGLMDLWYKSNVKIIGFILNAFIELNKWLVRLAIDAVKNYTWEIAKGLLAFAVGGLPALIALLASKAYEKGKEWYDAGKANAESYQQGFENSIQKFKIQDDINRGMQAGYDAERQAYAQAEREAQEKKIKELSKVTSPTGKTKAKDLEPIDAEQLAKQRGNREERLRQIEVETKANERAYNTRKKAAIDYYTTLNSLITRQSDIEKEEQRAIIERANRQLNDKRLGSLEDKGKRADQLRAEIQNALNKLGDIEAKRVAQINESSTKYSDYLKQIYDSYNEQQERASELAGRFDVLTRQKLTNLFKDKLDNINTELEATTKALVSAQQGSNQNLIDTLQKRVDLLKSFKKNLEFEKEVVRIQTDQLKIANDLDNLENQIADQSYTESEKFNLTVSTLSIAIENLKNLRQELKNIGASTTAIDSKIRSSENRLFSTKRNELERQYNLILEQRDKFLNKIDIRAKETSADKQFVDEERNKVLKSTAERIEKEVIPAYEALAKQFKQGSAEAETLRKAIEALKQQVVDAKTPDKSQLFQKNIDKVKERYDDLVKERDKKIREVERNNNLTENEKAYKRNNIYKEYYRLLSDIIVKWQELIASQTTGLNPEQIKQWNDELEQTKQNLNESQTNAKDFGTTLKEVAVDALASGLTNFFNDVLSGTKSLKEAALDFARSFLQAIQQVIIKMLVLKALTMLFNAFSPGLGDSLFAGMQGGDSVFGGLVGMATGGVLANPVGQINGQGSPKSDSVLTWFNSIGKFIKTSNREYVLDGETTNNLGVGFLDRVRATKGRILKPLKSMATGGSVSEDISTKASAINAGIDTLANNGDTNLNVSVGLSPVDFVKRAFAHSDGISALVEAIGNNKTKIKTRLELNGARI